METLQRLHNRGSISTGYDIDNSLKLEDGATEGMAKNFSGDGDQRTWTYSTWVKRTQISGSDAFHLFGGSYTNIQFMTNDLLRVELYDGASTVYADLNRVFRDTSAWYHIVVTLDTTQSTAADRVKIYINGVQDTSFNNSTYANMSQNAQFQIGSATADYQFGYYFVGGANDRRFCGYVAETHYVNGTALDATSFGEFDDDSGIWKPKEYTGSHGSKGFYFKFDDSSNLGKDSSSGGVGDFTLTNITAADQATDTPTNNFATFNAMHPLASSTNIRQGATQFYISSNWQTAVASIAVSKGKWYAEFSPDSSTTIVGFVDVEDAYIPQNHTGYYLGYAGSNQNRSVGMQGSNGVIMNDNNSATGATFGASDIISLALDMDNRKAYWAVNGTWVNSGNPANGTNGVTWATSSSLGDAWTDIITMGVTGYSNIHWKCNFGGFTLISISSGNADANGYGNFEYAPPSGYYALCTKNLEEYG